MMMVPMHWWWCFHCNDDVAIAMMMVFSLQWWWCFHCNDDGDDDEGDDDAFLHFCIFVFLYFCIFVFLYFCIFVFLYFWWWLMMIALVSCTASTFGAFNVFFSTGDPCKDRLILTAIPCRECWPIFLQFCICICICIFVFLYYCIFLYLYLCICVYLYFCIFLPKSLMMDRNGCPPPRTK